jgi:hypothetical protein
LVVCATSHLAKCFVFAPFLINHSSFDFTPLIAAPTQTPLIS